MSEWIRKYEITNSKLADENYYWSVVGKHGGVHLWIRPSPLNDGEFYGGVEYHYRVAPEGRELSPDNCWLIGCPCFHVGSSLAAIEKYIPLWLRNREAHEVIFDSLEWDALDLKPESEMGVEA
jgi:hypothetical protein